MSLVNEPPELATVGSHPTPSIGENKVFLSEIEVANEIKVEDNASASVSEDDESSECSTNLLRPLNSNGPAIEQTQPATLYALPDLCLIMVFRHFSLAHLHVMADVCTRFRRIAVSAFRLRYDKHYVCDKYLEPAMFVSCLRIFSPSNVRITLDNNDRLFGAIAEYCPNLESLSIRRPVEQAHELAAARSLLPQLKRISVQQANIWNEGADVDWLLERLHLNDYPGKGDEWMPKLKLPRLKEVRLRNGYVNVSDSSLLDFMARNGHIERLSIYQYPMVYSELRALAECVPNLRALTCYKLSIHMIDGGDNDPEPRSSVFKCLEEVTIWRGRGNIYLLNLLIGCPVKHLDISVEGPEAIGKLDQLTSVTRLTLRPFGRATVADVLQVINSMSGLREVHLRVGKRTTFKLGCVKRVIEESQRITNMSIRWHKKVNRQSTPELEEIAALIETRPKLRAEVEVPWKFFKVPDTVKRQHSGWLKVNESPIDKRQNDYFYNDDVLDDSDDGSFYDE